MTALTDPGELPEILRDLAVEAAGRAGRHALGKLHGPLEVDTKSSGSDFVTQVDRECEQLIVETILGERPDDEILGEEGTDRPGGSGVRWLIDPIDGTTNYVYGHPGWAVSVAAGIGDTIVAGAVADPMHAETFAAASGDGATCNGAIIRPTERTDLASSVLATGFGYEADRRTRQGEVLTDLLASVGNIRRVGAASTDLCWVACGRVDGYFEVGLSPWDYAAGALIGAEAGAVVSGLGRDEPSPSFVVAAGPRLHSALVTALLSVDAESRTSL